MPYFKRRVIAESEPVSRPVKAVKRDVLPEDIKDDVVDLLYRCAGEHGARGMTMHPLGHGTPVTVTYADLLARAERTSAAIQGLPGFAPGVHVLLHFEDPLDTIVWMWGSLVAGATPAISTPLAIDEAERAKHLIHLADLLEPLVLTRRDLCALFNVEQLQPHAIEDLDTQPRSPRESLPRCETALIMLTSGSTGNSKAVPLSHRQLCASVRGKVAGRPTPAGCQQLNWIGMDHVASVVEIHLLSMFEGVGQVHARAADIIADPLLLLRLCEQHRVTRTFAPNSFLRRLSEEIAAHPELDLDLSSLRVITSGGEANTVETGRALSEQLTRFGAAANTIMPGFGMTETCAGSIYNLDFPANDIASEYEYASLGACVTGIEMRIVPNETQDTDNVVGELQVRGPIVFEGYLNNATATADAFMDGWFRTGDQAYINAHGHLKLVGRSKDTLIINGVKYLPTDLEAAIDHASLEGIEPTYLACFAYRSKGMDTEGICVAYRPTYDAADSETRASIQRAVTAVVMQRTGCTPYVLPLTDPVMDKTSLGKISRQKLRVALEEGRLQREEEINRTALDAHRLASVVAPSTDLERQLHTLVTETLDIDLPGVECSFFEAGVTSIDLIRLKSTIESTMSCTLSFATLIANPTIRTLAASLGEVSQAYDPVVPLQLEGSKAPLWLIHPGVGEVLIFLSLAARIRDRPVYALRARGFNGEEYFGSIDEAVATYHAAIKAKQPHGPYAIAGYSYGSMLAFELTKRMQADGDEIRFLGCMNLPPHIKERMKQIDWIYGLLNLSYFLKLITEEHAVEVAPQLQKGTREEAVAHVAAVASQERLDQLRLSIPALEQWVDLSYALQAMAQTYEPSGSAPVMDVFVATPLKAVSPNRQDWRDRFLCHWKDFITDVRYHEVGGSHYTMIAQEHVDGFWDTMNAALEARGI